MGAQRSELARIVQSVRDGTGVARVLVGTRARGRTTALEWLAGAEFTVLRAAGSPAESAEPFGVLRQLPGADLDDLANWLTRAAPVLLLVDDVHWADPQSAECLAYAARRVAGHQVGVVLTAAAEEPLHDELARLPRFVLAGMDDDDVREMLPRAPEQVCSELIRLCGASPMVLRELCNSLSPDQIAGRVPLPRRVVLGRGSLRVFRQPWENLPEPARLWLLVLAHGPASFRVCLRAARSLGLELDDLAPAERAGVVCGRRWSDQLVRAAVRQSATSADTARVCAALAEAIDPVEWPVEHAHYLAGALTNPDRAAAALAAATVPMAQAGHLLDACDAALRASELTSDQTERNRYRIIAAELAWLAGYSDHALRLLDRAAPHSADAKTSAAIIRAVIHGFRESWANGWWLLPTETAPGSAEHALRLLVTVITAGWEYEPVTSLQSTIARLRGSVDPGRASKVRALEQVVAGAGDPEPEEREALRSLAWWARPSDALHPKAWPPPLLPAFLGEESRYAQMFSSLLHREPVQAAPSTKALLLLKLATAQLAMGQWDHAMGNANEGVALAEELGHHALCFELGLCSAWIAAARGDEQDYARLLERAARHQGRSSTGRQPALVQWIHGLAALSGGRPTEAFERLRGVQRSAETPQHALLRRLSTVDLVEAAVQAQRWSDVVEVVDEFAAWVVAGSARWAQLDLARCRALLDGEGAERWHLRALELSAATGRLFASARTEFHFGAWLRRNRRYREAREYLRTAEEHFVRIGATAWSRRAHAELRAAGESSNPRRRDGLTPQEREIALLAADGLTNREIAAKLALSPRTVGYHLYKIFPKLDITSRTQLPAALNAYSPSG